MGQYRLLWQISDTDHQKYESVIVCSIREKYSEEKNTLHFSTAVQGFS